MTPYPTTCAADDTVSTAARDMKGYDIGAVIVLDGGKVRGLITDRDIVVRAVADGKDPRSTTLGAICSGDLVSVAPGDGIDAAVQLMRDHGLRRLPVLDGDEPVGIVSIGDVAVERDPGSTLARISSAPPNG